MLSTSFLSLLAASAFFQVGQTTAVSSSFLPVVTALTSIAVTGFSSSSATITRTLTSSAVVTTAPATPRSVHPNGVGNKCMVVKDNNIYSGAPVVLGDCGNGNAWTFSQGDTLVRLGVSGYCLDAGSTPTNGMALKIWQCYDLNLEAQHWYYTNDRRIALAGAGLCVDLDGGNLDTGSKIQTWTCTDFNTNQIWTT